MDRVAGANTIDLGGGRNGFRGKDTVAGIPGTELTAAWHNQVQEELMAIIEKSGQAASGANLLQILTGIRSQAFNYRAAGGTANDITITLDPVPASQAALLSVPLRIKTGAAANTGPVRINPNAIGLVSLRGSDNVDLPGGALPANTIFECYWNGSWYQLTSIIPSAAAKAPAAFAMTTNAAQSIAAATQTVVANFTTVFNDTIDSTLAANQITIGTKDAGWWVIGGKLMYDFPASGTMYANLLIERNTVEIGAGNAPGTTSIRARPQAMTVYKLSAGDVIRLTTATDTARNLSVTSGNSIFSGFKVGA